MSSWALARPSPSEAKPVELVHSLRLKMGYFNPAVNKYVPSYHGDS